LQRLIHDESRPEDARLRSAEKYAEKLRQKTMKHEGGPEEVRSAALENAEQDSWGVNRVSRVTA